VLLTVAMGLAIDLFTQQVRRGRISGMFGLESNTLPLLLPLAVFVLWYRAFGRQRFSILALLVLIWTVGWAFVAVSQRGIF